MDNSPKRANLEYIKLARAKIAEGWTQDSYARTAKGQSCGACDPSACSWCAEGALIHAAGGNSLKYINLNRIVANRLGKNRRRSFTLPYWNDELCKTQDEVLAGFDQVIKELESELE